MDNPNIYCEFEFESLTVREYVDVLQFSIPGATNDKTTRLIEIMQAHTNANIVDMPFSELSSVVNQFTTQFKEYMRDCKLGGENG